MRLFWALLLLHSAQAWSAASVTSLQERPAPALFLKTESFPLPAGATEPLVIYGNKEIGEFALRGEVRSGKVWISFVPPTYRAPVSFRLEYLTKEGKPARLGLGSRNYRYPGVPLFQSAPVSHGRFSFPFFMMNVGALTPSGDSRFLPAIVNSLGEVVWYSYGEGTASARAIMMRSLGNGRYGFLRRLKNSRFTIKNFRGEVEKSLVFAELNFPPSSHGYKHIPGTSEILYLGFECRKIPWYKEFLPLFSGPAGWWNLIRLPRRSYRGGTLLRLNYETGKVSRVWGSFDSFEPEHWPSLFVGAAYSPDRFQDARTPEQYRNILFDRVGVGDWGEGCHVDWTHENSVDYHPEAGYLVSIRNLNLLALIGLDGKLVWKLGEDPRAEIRLPTGKGFGQQHSASFLPNGDILVFDNNIAFRGFVGERLKSRLLVIRKPVKGQPGEIAASIDLPAPQTVIRGSAARLRNGNYFAYVPGAAGTREVVVEVDHADPTKMIRMELGGEVAGRGIEAIPLYAIGNEELVEAGKTVPPVPEKPAGAPALTPSNLIDLTY